MLLEGPETTKDRTARVMAALAAGDGEAIGELFEISARPLRNLVLGCLGQANIWPPADAIDDIVRELALELVRLAPSWKPEGGAAPWHWARGRLVRMTFTCVGQLCDDIDDQHHLEAAPSMPPSSLGANQDGWDTLTYLASHHPGAATLARYLADEVSERDRRVWLDHAIEKGNGNRSPAVTVAELHDISPAAARKIVQRVREKLARSLAHEHDDLRDLPALAA